MQFVQLLTFLRLQNQHQQLCYLRSLIAPQTILPGQIRFHSPTEFPFTSHGIPFPLAYRAAWVVQNSVFSSVFQFSSPIIESIDSL